MLTQEQAFAAHRLLSRMARPLSLYFGGRAIRAILRLAVAAFALIALSHGAMAAASGVTLWYEPSNGGKAGGSLPDFLRLFDPATAGGWQQSQHEVSVLLLRDNTIENAEREHPGFIRSLLAPFLARTGMKLGIDSGVATFASCRQPRDNAHQLETAVDLLRRIEAGGIRISYLSLQSTLSKVRNAKTDCPTYSLDQRIADTVWFISGVKAGLGPTGDNIQFGLIDASVAKGPKWIRKELGVARIEDAYTALLAGLAKHGLRLSYVHLDHPWEAFRDFDSRGQSSLADVREAQNWFVQHGITTGVLVTSVQSTSEAEFDQHVIQVERGILANGVPGEQLVLAAWSHGPQTELPERPDDPHRFPMTRVLDDLAGGLRQAH
jgi:hypothetical protein